VVGTPVVVDVPNGVSVSGEACAARSRLANQNKRSFTNGPPAVNEKRRSRGRKARVCLVVTRTRSGKCWIASSLVKEEVGSRKVAAAEVRMRISVYSVGPGLGDNVQDHIPGLAIFRVVVVG